MKRYNVPRLCFINKLDRLGCNPERGVTQLRDVLGLNASPIQVPIGLENDHEGVVDIIRRLSYTFEGPKGESVKVSEEIPPELVDQVETKRMDLLERLAEVDDEFAEIYLESETEDIASDAITSAVRRATIAQTFVPVFMGSAFKNKGVQPLLDGVMDYLPSPLEVSPPALRRNP